MKQFIRKLIISGFVIYLLIVIGWVLFTFIPESEQFWENVGPRWEQMLKQ